ncbi:MAG: ATPase [Rhizobacter sp.]|nr:ATPase [Chlorobiales bacterium]
MPATTVRPLTILCLASYEKGAEFMRECKRHGCRVLLVTVKALEHAPWPRDVIDDIFFMIDMYRRDDVIAGISYLARTEQIDRIVALDDYDVEFAALLREHLRVAGMGDTTARYFRDKLAMRSKAQSGGILVPHFVPAINNTALAEFMQRVSPPWVLKPRSEASSVGIQKINGANELWPALDRLGDRRSFYLLEKYVAGSVYHVDSIISETEIVFSAVHQYGKPPMDVAHGGGVFTTRTLERDSPDLPALLSLNTALINTMGCVRGVTHTEFIKGTADGKFYFLETASRVGGANIVEMVEAATGLNLWREWAKIEIGGEDAAYTLPARREDYAGILISLARQEWPDTSAYTDAEIVWRLSKQYHVGLIVASPDHSRVSELLAKYMARITTDFSTSMPSPEKPTS